MNCCYCNKKTFRKNNNRAIHKECEEKFNNLSESFSTLWTINRLKLWLSLKILRFRNKYIRN